MHITTSPQCPLCGYDESREYHRDRRRIYLQCSCCKLVFVPPEFHLSKTDEKALYDLHINHPGDVGYRNFLSRLTSPMTERLSSGQKGLDYGCGPGPTLSVMLQEQGFPMEIYDYIYFTDDSVLNRRYDFLCSTEVAEHLHHPREVWRLWFDLLNPDGWLGIMTKRVTDRQAFTTWHYIHDLSHICFYSEETLNYLAELYSARVIYPEKDVALFQKG